MGIAERSSRVYAGRPVRCSRVRRPGVRPIPAMRTGGGDTSAQQARWGRAAPDWSFVVVRLGRARLGRLSVGIVLRVVRRCVGFLVVIVGRRLGIVLCRFSVGIGLRVVRRCVGFLVVIVGRRLGIGLGRDGL